MDYKEVRIEFLGKMVRPFLKHSQTSSKTLLAQALKNYAPNQEIRELKQRQKEAETQLKEVEKVALALQKSEEEAQNLRSRLEQIQARRTALEEEQGSTLDNQKEIDRLNQQEKNLKTDLKNEENEIKELTE